jgi:GT2 family glycosyltransferase
MKSTESETIRKSGLFDDDWYVSHYPDVALTGLEPLEHYIRIGSLLDRDPHPAFSATYYRKQLNEQGMAPVSALLHYINDGWRLKLNPHPLFDVGWYLSNNGDVAKANHEPLRHFLEHGCFESRDPHPSFNAGKILQENPRLLTERLNPLAFYLSLVEQHAIISRSKAGRDSFIWGPDAPFVSIIVATYKTPQSSLQAMVRSVRAQTYPFWNLCIVDDGSEDPLLTQSLEALAQEEPRILVGFSPKNEGISQASNKAISLATGEYMAFLDHDDTLDPEALECCVKAISSSGADVVYTDQDTVTDDGRVLWTFHKPDWSPEYLRHVMYVGHLLVVRSTLVKQLGGFIQNFDGVQDFEFMIRLSEVTDKMVHVPKVLYHWHAIAGSIASSTDAKPGIADAQVRAVQAYLERNLIPATAAKHPTLPHRCRTLPQLTQHPKTSIIIPSKDQAQIIKTCLDSIYGKTTYPDFEVIVVDSGTTEAEALDVYRTHPIQVLPLQRSFNFSAACNLGADAASGEILIFLNNDTEVITSNWLEHLVFHLSDRNVGAAGPMLLYPNGRVQHAGVVLGSRGTADHVARHFPADSDGYAGSLSCPREVSAVTGACLAMKKTTFKDVAGFSELYGTHYQDVDLCLKLRQQGLRCIYTSEARLFHHESVSRGEDSYDILDRHLLIDSWRNTLSVPDPFYPRYFSLERLDYSAN